MVYAVKVEGEYVTKKDTNAKSETDYEAGKCCVQRDDIRTSWEPNDNEEVFDPEKCHGMYATMSIIISLG